MVSRKGLRTLPTIRQILYVKLLALTLNIPIKVSVTGAYLQLVLYNCTKEIIRPTVQKWKTFLSRRQTPFPR